MKKPIWIGLTGGACSGKSTVSSLIQGYGIPVFNLDTIGHELLEKDARVVAGLKKICGETIMDGFQVNRKRVREILFSSPEKKREIEAFLHPLIWNRFLELSKEAEKGERFIVCEAALIIESSLHRQMSELVVVIASENQRIERLMQRDDVSKLLATQMIRSQTDDATRKSHATIVIENEGSLQELHKKVDRLIDTWTENKLLKRK